MEREYIEIPARFFREQKEWLADKSAETGLSQAQILRDLVSAEMRREARRG